MTSPRWLCILVVLSACGADDDASEHDAPAVAAAGGQAASAGASGGSASGGTAWAGAAGVGATKPEQAGSAGVAGQDGDGGQMAGGTAGAQMSQGGALGGSVGGGGDPTAGAAGGEGGQAVGGQGLGKNCRDIRLSEAMADGLSWEHLSLFWYPQPQAWEDRLVFTFWGGRADQSAGRAFIAEVGVSDDGASPTLTEAVLNGLGFAAAPELQSVDAGFQTVTYLEKFGGNPVELQLDSPPHAVKYHVGWDGEAFAIHEDADDRGYVARVSAAGEVLLQPTSYGKTYGHVLSAVGRRVYTDPTSGVTYVVTGGGKSVRVVAHDREGAPLWGAPEDEPISYTNANLTFLTPEMTADPEGAFILQHGSVTGTMPGPERVLPHAIRVNREGKFSEPLVLDGMMGIEGADLYGGLSTGAGDAIFVASSWLRVYVWELKGGVLSPPRVLIDTGAAVPETIGGVPGFGPENYEQFLKTVVMQAGEQRWLLVQYNGQGGQKVELRLVRIDDPTCTYPARNPVKAQ